MIRPRRTSRWALQLAADLTMVAMGFLLAWKLRFDTGWIPAFDPRPPFRPYGILLGFILGTWTILLQVAGAGHRRRHRTFREEVNALLQAHSLGLLLTFAWIFFLRIDPFSRVLIVLFCSLSTILLVAERGVTRWLVGLLGRRGFGLRRVLLVGAGEGAREALKRFQWRPEMGYRFLGLLASEAAEVGRRIRRVPVVGTYGDAEAIARSEDVDLIVFALPTEDEKRLPDLLAEIADLPLDVWVVPDFARHVRLRGGIAELDGLPLISLQGSPLGGWSAIVKRAIDLVVAAACLVLLSPLLLAIAVAVRLTSGGPVLYRQERMGLDGQRFQILKFRTMIPGADTGGARAARRGDPRVTPLGRLLRRASLDELPQLVNVLRGEMSLVGPRPERPVFIEDLRRQVPRYMLRHRVRAGMTGFAQVNGLRGHGTSMRKRLDYDLFYIENWSVWLDLKILWLTLPAVLRGRGAV